METTVREDLLFYGRARPKTRASNLQQRVMLRRPENALALCFEVLTYFIKCRPWLTADSRN